jgi:DNA-binding response OmpR family regulator
MEVLLVEKDPLIRDQVKVGLQQFPDCAVTAGTGHAAINQLRGRHFDCVFLGVDPRHKDTAKLLRSLRQVDAKIELFVLTAERNVRDMGVDKGKYDIHSFLHTPLDLREFFGLVGRFRERNAERDGQPSRRSRGRARGSVGGPG